MVDLYQEARAQPQEHPLALIPLHCEALVLPSIEQQVDMGMAVNAVWLLASPPPDLRIHLGVNAPESTVRASFADLKS